ncbi:MAG TPA: ribonuclease P protein component [Bacteroidales bacterium]|nr:ribonuclease P protein component [Bacteroidales bacterium]
MKRFSFAKHERLVLLNEIDSLFKEGKSYSCSPLRILYRPNTTGKIQVIVTISRKRFKRAVDRNSIKRKIREAYRLNKELLKPIPSYNSLNIAFIYTGDNKNAEYAEIENSLVTLMKRLLDQFSEPVHINTEKKF